MCLPTAVHRCIVGARVTRVAVAHLLAEATVVGALRSDVAALVARVAHWYPTLGGEVQLASTVSTTAERASLRALLLAVVAVATQPALDAAL